jgi:hypothetical protein
MLKICQAGVVFDGGPAVYHESGGGGKAQAATFGGEEGKS